MGGYLRTCPYQKTTDRGKYDSNDEEKRQYASGGENWPVGLALVNAGSGKCRTEDILPGLETLLSKSSI